MIDAPLAPVESTNLPDVARVRELAAGINFDDPSLSITYGAQTMTGIASFADSMLSRVRAKDAGPVGETLTDLLLKVKGLDVDELASGKKSLMQSIPLIGSLFNKAERSLARFNTLSGQVETIASNLDGAMVGLLKDIEVLEQLYQHNQSFHQELSLYIEAGKQRLEQIRAEELPALQAEAEKSGNNMDAQKVRDLADKMNRFERRLHDLQLSRTITVQTAPQIRLIQGNNQTLAEKIQTSVLTTIPIWKSQMVLALSLQGQRSAAKLQKDVADTTNELLRKNAEMLQGAAVETAREVERSVVDIETLRDVQSRLVSTIEETLRIAEDGRTRRAEVEQELQGMEQDLRTRLTSLATAKTAGAIEHASGGKALPESTEE